MCIFVNKYDVEYHPFSVKKDETCQYGLLKKIEDYIRIDHIPITILSA